MRDDLVVELAKRGSTDPQKIRGIRGMERGTISIARDGVIRRLSSPEQLEAELAARGEAERHPLETAAHELQSQLGSCFRRLEVGLHPIGPVTVRLVDHEQIGDLEDPGLDRLHLVTGPGRHLHTGRIRLLIVSGQTQCLFDDVIDLVVQEPAGPLLCPAFGFWRTRRVQQMDQLMEMLGGVVGPTLQTGPSLG